MDSILNNTSWAFIQGLGYKITGYYTEYKSDIDDANGTNYPYILPRTFTTAFIDIIIYQPNISAWTLRPILMDVSSGNFGLYSTWMISSTDEGYEMVVPSPCLQNKTPHPDRYPYTWFLSDRNLYIRMKYNGSSVSSDIMIFIYYIE